MALSSASKRPKSHRLGYGKPRVESEVPELPREAVAVDPVTYIRCWDKYNYGQPVDIMKAKPGTRADLMKADPRYIELMLQYGVTQKQIAQIFNTPSGSLTRILKRLGVDTKISLVISNTAQEVPEEQPAASPAAEIPTPSPEPAAGPEEMWFTHPRPSQAYTEPLVIIKKDKIFFTAAIRNTLPLEYVQFGLTQENLLKVRSTDSGFHFHKQKVSVSCSDLIHELQWRGIKLPAVFHMAFDEGAGLWEGELQDEDAPDAS